MSITPAAAAIASLPSSGAIIPNAPAPVSDASGQTVPSNLVFTASGAIYNGRDIALSDIIENRSGNFTSAQKARAQDLLKTREKEGFALPDLSDAGAPSDAQKQARLLGFYQSYVNYLKTLSPAERASDRYNGQLQAAEATLRQLQDLRFDAGGSPSSTPPQSPGGADGALAGVVQRTETLIANLARGSASGSTAQETPAVQISLSPEAQKRLAAGGSFGAGAS